MLTWKELQEQAKRILTTAPNGDYELISFQCKSGGSPRNKVGVPEFRRTDKYQYHSPSCGSAYSGEVVISARKTGAFDGRGLEIYEAENGILFVYQYRPGSIYGFDWGRFLEPKLE